jgi:predicted RND superfamily exporter protein
LYFDVEDLEDVVDRAKARLDYEKKIRNPFYISLDDEKPPDIGFDDLMNKYMERLTERGASGIIKARDKKESGGVDLGDRFASSDGHIMTVVARPAEPATDMLFGRALVEKAEKILEASNPRRNPDMRAEVAGPYRNRYREYNTIVGDIYSSLSVSMVLILAVIIVYFRRARIVALIFMPLLVGIIWTVGLTALTIGRLNMTTALIFAVLLGLGIDFGVHMSVRYLDERARGKSLRQALALAVIHTGKAILTAGLTTAGGLAVLTLARFKGFSEFGIIATMGIVLCLLVYLLLLPAMAVVWERFSVPKPWRKYGTDAKSGINRSAPWPLKKVRVYLGLVVLAFIGSALCLPLLEFEYNFRNLRGEKVSATIKYGKTLSSSSSPVVAVLDTPEDGRIFTRQLEKVIDEDVENKGLLKRAFSIFSFVPDEQQSKLDLLEKLRKHVDEALRLKKLKSKTKKDLENTRQWTFAEPISLENLPTWVTSKFKEKDGTLGRMVYLYPRVDEWKVNEMAKFYDAYSMVSVPGKEPVRTTASGFIFVEVVRAVQRDGWLMTVAATIVVLVILFLDLRSVRKALFVFLPLVIGMCWTGGLMALFDIRIGLYNMLVLPTLLGVGIDASVHFFHAYKEHGPGSLGHVFSTTGVAIVIAALTTAVGFTGMLVVSHNGLKSIGVLAVIGIVACLAGALITLPLLLSLGEKRDSQ